MNEKLRLLITTKCPNNCSLCCNKNFDLDSLENVNSFDQYDEVSITGGEPLLNFGVTTGLVMMLQGIGKKVYLYTSVPDYSSFRTCVSYGITGITLTLHTKKDLDKFLIVNKWMCEEDIPNMFEHSSLVLKHSGNLGITQKQIEEDFYLWKVKEFTWRENCPIPEGEDLKKFILF